MSRVRTVSWHDGDAKSRNALFRPHGGERQHLPNAVVVCQEHDEPVNTHAPAARRGQAVLQGSAEGLVDELGLVVTLGLLAGLLLEPQALFARDVQFRVTTPC